MTALATKAAAARSLATVTLKGDEPSLFAAVVDHHMHVVESGSEAWPQGGAGGARSRPTIEGAFIHGDLPVRAEAGLVLRCARAPGSSNGWLSQIDVETESGRRYACEILSGFLTKAGNSAPVDLFGESDTVRARYMREAAAGDRFVPRPNAAVRRNLGHAIGERSGVGGRFVALEDVVRRHEADAADLRGVGLRPVHRRVHACARLDDDEALTITTWSRPAGPSNLSVRLFSIVTADGRPVPLASCETLYAL